MKTPAMETATPAPTQRTDEEIAELKRQWDADPCWDIEATEGFEMHAAELLAYRQVKTTQWAQWQEERKEREAKSERERIERRAVELDLHGYGAQSAFNTLVIDRLDTLNDALARIADRLGPQ